MRDSLVSVEVAAASEELVDGKGESLFGSCGVNPSTALRDEYLDGWYS